MGTWLSNFIEKNRSPIKKTKKLLSFLSRAAPAPCSSSPDSNCGGVSQDVALPPPSEVQGQRPTWRVRRQNEQWWCMCEGAHAGTGSARGDEGPRWLRRGGC
ncbi:hypothetical protein ES332_D01G128500v1 [Gossypium tomentosum]|uniref:Uncharacterized protein n=1 Tax=Gossypium tomentosum TaxID=34277 RepID=A0A5D2M8G5_GOSTO|nr:hypothetical protein ES332_D01G128500v1 [Gossypium tomentosum]